MDKREYELVFDLPSKRRWAMLGFTSMPQLVNFPAPDPSSRFTLVFSPEGYVLAHGAPASLLATEGRGGVETPVSAIPDVSNPFAIAAPPPSIPEPAEGDTPARWLERIGDLTQLRDWVFTQGLASSAGSAWALFAKSMDWAVPVESTASVTTVPEGSADAQAP